LSKLPAKTTKTRPPAAKTAAKPAAKAAAGKAASKPAGKHAAAPAKKPAAPNKPSAAKPMPKPKPKAAAKPAAKPVAKKPAAKKAAAPTKPVVKAAPAKAPTKVAVKTSVKASVKPPVVAAPAKPAPAAKAAAKPAAAAAAAPAAKPTPAPAPAPVPKSPSKSAGKASAPSRPGVIKPGPTPANAPPPAPTPAGIRFMDRFAPAKHTRSPDPIEVQKTVHKADPKLANAWKTKPGRELSEAELLAMPDGEYMNDKQMEFFRLRLQQQKDDLLSNAEDTTEHLREDTSIVPDPADRATIEEEHALELRTRDRERKLLKKIAQSLARLDSGDYGYCDETGEPIGLARLLARPTATLSLEAQQRRELKQKMFGD
jgi:DnaK suppressor protein